MVFEKSKWIWTLGEQIPDSYAEFKDEFEYEGGTAVLNLSVDTDYALFINGRYFASNQYGDFEHYKIYDSLDITESLQKGKNDILFLVYYCGKPTSRYLPANAGLIYELTIDGEVILASGEGTPSRIEPHYVPGRDLMITRQLGYSFCYDATAGCDAEFSPSRVVNKNTSFFERPIKKLTVKEELPPRCVNKISDSHYLIDLGGETVGLPSIRFYSEKEQTIKFCWGEHLEDGGVRVTVGGRNFYFEYKAKAGENIFDEFMLRLGCRYIEIFAEEKIELEYAGIRPTVYETKDSEFIAEDELNRKIYDISLNTLKKCMMEHYVDCPWREQALYVFDSRNQMLCGYYAFSDKNADYAKSNLKLISEDRRDDGLLSICAPCGTDRCIPSFSLYYALSVNEYLRFTGDADFARSVCPRIEAIIDDVLSHRENGLCQRYEGERYWNFYDWSEYSVGSLDYSDKKEADLMINCLTVHALMQYKEITDAVGISYKYGNVIEELRRNINSEFMTEGGAYTMLNGTEQFTVLGNTMAILSGVAQGEGARAICEMIVSGKLADCSLSMKALVYDAFLSVDEKKYAPLILEEIRSNYKKMLDYGSDTTWETIDGAPAFEDAGSLCHGWTAVPIWIFNRLKELGYRI